MLIKNKLIIFVSLLILLLSVTTVSAAELNDTNVDSQNNDLISINSDDAVLNESNINNEIFSSQNDDVLSSVDSTITLKARDYAGSGFKVLKNEKVYFDVTSNPALSSSYYYKIFVNNNKIDTKYSFNNDGTASFSLSRSTLGDYSIYVRVYSSGLFSSGTADSNKLTMTVVDALKDDTTLMLSSRDYGSSSFSVAKGDKLYFDVTSNPAISDGGAYYKVLFNDVESDNSFTFGSDGKGAFSWTPSSIKTYTLSVVSYNSSTYNNAVSNTLTVNVLEKTTITLMANATKVKYGEIVKFTPTVYDSNNNEITSGNVTYYIDGKTWTTTPVNRNLQGTMNLGGIHNISVKYQGYGSYAPSNFAYVILTVGKLQTDLNMTVTTVNYPNNPVLSVKTSVDGNYNIKVADLIDEHIVISNGFCEFILKDLNIGDYEAQVIFDGDDDYDSITKTISFSVLRQIAGFNLNPIPDTINYGESIKLNSFADNNQATGHVDYYVDGIYNVTAGLMDEITLTGFDYGPHTILANYSGDTNFMNDSKTVTFTVLDGRSDLNFIVNSDPENAEINYGDNLVLTPFASVSDVGGSFDFYVDGVYNASCTFGNNVTLSGLSIGSHSITVNYTGDSNYASSTYSLNCNVVDARKDPNFRVTSNLNDDNAIEYGENLKLTSLTVNSDATGNVDYYLDNNYYASSNLMESVSISDLEYGLHTVSAIYSGDSNYKNASDSISFTVTAALIKTNVELLINNSKETIVRINLLESLNFTNIITPLPGNVRIRLYESNIDTGINAWYANTWISKTFYNEGIYHYAAVFEGNDEYARSVSNEITVIVGNPDSLNTTSMKLTCRPVLKPQNTIFHVGEELRITASILKGDGTSLQGVGNITVYDNGNYYTFRDLESAGSRAPIIYLTYNTVGTHNISVYFSGSENYSECSGWIQFEIVKYDVNLSVTVNDVDYPSYITANIISDVPGNYSVVISNKTYDIALTENELSKSLEIEDIFDAGDYEAVVKINESDLYNSKSTSCKFKVFKSDSSKFSIITEKESNPTIVIHTSLDDYATGTVIFYENNSDLAIGNCSLGESWTYAKLEEGYHTLIAKYSGDKNHESAVRNVTVFIDEIPRFRNTTLTLEINNVHIKAGDIVRITPVVLDDRNMGVNEGDVTFYDENDNVLATNILELTAMKNITIKARYNGVADKYNSSGSSIDLIVYLDDADIEFFIDDVSYPTTPVAIIMTNAKGSYSIKLLNKTYVFEINDGENNKLVVLDSLPVGNYTAVLTYDGNEFYNKKEVSADFKVNKSEISVFNIIITPNTVIYGNSIILTSTLGVDDAKGNVTYSDGENIIGIKNIGEALIINDLDSGEYDILAIYDGDDKYNPAVTSVHVSILKANITLSVSVEDVEHSDLPVLNVNANLDDLYNVTLGDKKLTVKVVNGKGSVELPLLDVGSYNITVYHNGNRNYNSNNVISKFNVAPSHFDFEITSDSYSINYGEYVTLTPKLPNDAQGIITFTDSNNNALGTISANETFKTNKLGIGNNIITAMYSDDVNYNDADVKININVNKLNTTIITSQTTLNLVVGDNVKIDAYLNPDNAGYLVYKSGDESVVRITSDAQMAAVGEGSASIIISFAGNEIYNPSEAKVNVIVSSKDVPIIKKDANMSISSFVQANNATITVTLYDDASGTVSILNQRYSVNNGKATVYLHDLPEGTSILQVTYSGDDKYNSIEDNITIVVKTVIPKKNITLDVNAPEINEGMDAVITVSLPSDASGNVSIYNQSALVAGGKAVIMVSDLHEGNHVLPVSYFGDEKYNPCITNVTVHVNPKKSEINIDAPNVIKFYGGSERFRVKLTDLEGNSVSNQLVEINISGRQYNKTTNANGTVTAPLGLNSGNYTALVNVNGTVAMANVSILPTVRGNDVFKVFRNASQYIATFTDSHGNYLAEGTSVEFNINGVLYVRNVRSNGAARLNLNLEQGTYVITAFNSVTGERCANNIIIISRIIENRDITKYFRNSTQYTVKVLGDDGNPVGKGVNVTFNINGLFYNRATNNDGVAKLNINLQPGDYVITAEYGGCRASNNIKVLPVLSAENLTMKFNDGSQFKVKLVDGQGNSLSNATVGFNINGVFYTRTTNSEGIARLNIKLQSGEYIITSSYNGSNIANKITIS